MVKWIQPFQLTAQPLECPGSLILGSRMHGPAGNLFASRSQKMTSPWSERSDLEVIRLHLEGSPKARAELGLRLGVVGPLVRARNSKISKALDRQVLEELTQDTIAAILGGLHRFTGEAPLKTWASGFVSHIFYKYFERSKRWRELIIRAQDELVELTSGITSEFTSESVSESTSGSTSESTSESTSGDELDELKHIPVAGETGIFWDIINSMHADERKTLWLYIVEDMSFSQVATMLGEPTTTTKSRHSRSMLKLKTRLGSYWREHNGDI